MVTRTVPPAGARIVTRTSTGRPSVYWWPYNTDGDATWAGLAARAGATKLIPLQDPVDNVNLRGTIVGGQLEVFLNDAAAAEIKGAPELVVGLWPTTINPPGLGAAALKEYEEFIWHRQLMDTVVRHSAAGTDGEWHAALKFTTKRKVPQRGMRLGVSIANHDSVTAFGAGSVAVIFADLYLMLDA